MKKNQNTEWVFVPNDPQKSISITDLISSKFNLFECDLTYNSQNKSGFYINREQYITIANAILNNPNEYRTVEIFSKDNKGYHLLSTKDFRTITKRGIKKIDSKLKKSIKIMKDNSKSKKQKTDVI